MQARLTGIRTHLELVLVHLDIDEHAIVFGTGDPPTTTVTCVCHEAGAATREVEVALVVLRTLTSAGSLDIPASSE